MIVRVAGAAPIRGRQPLYFLDDVFLARAKVPAPEKSDRFGFGIEGETTANVAEMKEVEKEEEIGEGVGKGELPDGNGAEQEESSGHVQGDPVERMENGAEQRDEPEAERSMEPRDSVKPERQSDSDPGVSVESGERVVEQEQQVQPEPERNVKVEGGHEIAR